MCPNYNPLDQRIPHHAPPTPAAPLAVVPKFIQSSYYEIFLTELFPQVEVSARTATDAPGSRAAHVEKSNADDGEREDRFRMDSLLEDSSSDPEALARRIAEAVASAREVAAAAAAAAAAEADAAKAAQVAAAKDGRDKVRAAGLTDNRRRRDSHLLARK